MRFDDSLATVLAADTASGMGATAAWRQLVDLTGRGRVADIDAAVDRLRTLRPQVPAAVRAASGRALAWTNPPAELVALFAQDELAVAAPVLRTARLESDAWLGLLPHLTPAARSILRNRRDHLPEVTRALASFGATDFVLGHDGIGAMPEAANDQNSEPSAQPLLDPATVEHTPTPFVAVGEIARALPVVAEAMRQNPETPAPGFEIAELVARIAAFRRDKPAPAANAQPAPEQFRFETDAAGVVRWIDGVARGPLVGISLGMTGQQGAAQLDAGGGGAVRTRSAFRDIRLEVAGSTSAGGSWRLSGVPRFDPVSGRFTGLAGTGRRPRREESAPPVASRSDQLRQLVHELRTPTNAIAGFAELIGTELLGPVPPVYLDRAQLIRRQTAELVAAIDDLDTAARLEGDALELRPGTLDLSTVLTNVVADLQPLATERRVTLTLDAAPGAWVNADHRAATRLLDRLLTVTLATAEPGERLRAQLVIKARGVRLHLTRPRALKAGTDDALLAVSAGTERDDGLLLGTGFTLRLVRNLAAALGGVLTITPDRLTLRLPAAVTAEVERAGAQ